MSRCISCGDIVPEGRQVCWACEHGITPSVKREAKPYWWDILAANEYCKKQGWISYRITFEDGKGYTVSEIKGAPNYGE